MGVIATFVYADWTAMYSEFASPITTEMQATMYFTQATLYHRNDGGGPVTDLMTQTMLLYMLTGHIAARYTTDLLGNPASPVVGRLSSFSEGSASGSAEYQGPQTAAWYLQTKYGADYWEATSQFRTAFYTRGRQRQFGIGGNAPWVAGYNGGGWWA